MEKICIKYNNDFIRLGDYVHLKREPSNVYYKVCKIQQLPNMIIITIMDYKGKFYTTTVDDIDKINKQIGEDYDI